jgi:O-antigen ligase
MMTTNTWGEKSQLQCVAIRKKAEVAGKWTIAAIGFSIPISTALDTILLSTVVLLWFVSGNYREKIAVIRNNTMALLAVIAFSTYILGSFYSVADTKEIFEFLLKGANFLLIPLMMPFIRDKKTQQYAFGGFLSATVLILALSYLIWLNVLPPTKIFKGSPDNPMVFKLHITQNLFMAFGAFMFALYARHASSRLWKNLCIVFCLTAIFNVLFMVHGKTGHVVLSVLIIYFLFDWFRLKGLLVGFLVLVSLWGIGYSVSSGALRHGTDMIIQQMFSWNESKKARSGFPVEERLEWYATSIQIIKENPFFGTGTGSFKKVYAHKASNSQSLITVNPHNEYLMIAVQLGLVGLGVWLYLFYRQFILADQLPSPFEKAVAQGLVLTILTASMVTSTLIDHSERLFYIWMSALLFAGLNAKTAKGHEASRAS